MFAIRFHARSFCNLGGSNPLIPSNINQGHCFFLYCFVYCFFGNTSVHKVISIPVLIDSTKNMNSINITTNLTKDFVGPTLFSKRIFIMMKSSGKASFLEVRKHEIQYLQTTITTITIGQLKVKTVLMNQ